MVLGLLFSKASKEQIDSAREYGSKLGLAFQLHNEMRDFFEEKIMI